MSWNYDPTLADPISRVRFLVGDRDPLDQRVLDEEIAYMLAVNAGSELDAAIEIVEGLISYYASLVSNTMDAAQEMASDVITHYEKVLAMLRRKLGRRAVPYFGGLTETDKQGQELNTDAVRPFFRRDKGLGPGVGRPASAWEYGLNA